MILQFIMLGVVQFIASVINFIPTFELTFVSDAGQFIQWLAWTNYYLPLEDFFAGSMFVLACWVIGAVIRVVIDVI